jgi:hypothetical protein
VQISRRYGYALAHGELFGLEAPSPAIIDKAARLASSACIGEDSIAVA